MENTSTAPAPSARLASIDALRGFDMFLITGGSALVLGICAALGAPACALALQMKHVAWAGLAQHDTIFPLFLFLAGVSWPFSLASQEARGRTTRQILLKIASRSAILFLLGFSFGGILSFKSDFRLMGVLQFIGLSWGIAAAITLFVRGKFAVASVAGLLLAGYWALLHFSIAPGAPEGAWSYSPEWNIVSHLDRTLWPDHVPLFRDQAVKYEPESFFSLPSGVALALFGILAGSLLRRAAASGGPKWRASGILAASAAAAGAAAWVSVSLLGDPIVKKLWTVSFVLVSVSYSLAMLCVFYTVVDVLGFKRWTVVFDPVGKNSILAYLMMMTGVQHVLKRWLFAGLCEQAGEWGDAAGALGGYLAVWAMLLWLRGRKAFLKV